MNAYIDYLNNLTNKNRLQYPEYQEKVNWVSYSEALEKEEERKLIIEKLEHKINRSFKNTKLWINSLSKGCQLCGEGEWSCLFITGKCNAKCFYCPATQQNDGVPSTQSSSFENVNDYIQYLEYFGFKGASLSGGEPFIVFERTLDYIKNIKRHFGDRMYLWMYTNGILGSEERYKQLADAGLDEIRIDIGASNYDLKYLNLAKGIIPNLTVEIPAVPEKFDRLTQMIPELEKLGVTNMNLHQLRLTNYNAPKLLQKKYTYLHGEQATVLESELTALKIIEFVADQKLKIGVNYCSFHFKNRFQKAGFRKKIASKFMEPNEYLTEKGYLRSITNNDSVCVIHKNELVSLDQKDLSGASHSFKIKYKGYVIDDHRENLQFLKRINIGNKAYFLRTGLANDIIELDSEQVNDFIALTSAQGEVIPDEKDLFSVWKNEFIEWDLRGYF